MSSPRSTTVAIIGAGIAGLTLALALARKGITSHIIERSPELTEVGAGLQISPNASRILRDLEVLELLQSVWMEPKDIRLVSGISLDLVATVPCMPYGEKRWGAPYGVLHRATLQSALLERVRAAPLCHLHLGQAIDYPTKASVEAVLGTPVDLLVGADGVWSKTRDAISGSAPPKFSGSIAWRLTVPQAQAPAVLRRENITAFLGADAHMVCYPLCETSTFNIVAVASGAGLEKNWATRASTADVAALKKRFAGWHPTLRQTLETDAAATLWPLYEVADGRWDNGIDTVLIGDAAHAMTPFAAQGAAMAIEDAFALAALVARLSVPEATIAFRRARAPRIARLRQRAAFNRFAYHAKGPVRIGRNLVLGLRQPESLANDFDWLYGYHVPD